MDTQPLKLTVDSKAAQADLAALAKALDKAGASVEKMQGKFVSGMTGTDAALQKSMQSMGKFAEVANLVGKIKINGDPSKQIREFANAMGALSRAKAIDAGQITGIKTLTKTLAELKVPTGAARLTEFLNAVGSARAPTQAQIGRLKDTLKLLANYQPTAATRNVQALSTFFNTISNIKAPSEATLGRLSKLFTVLSEAKAIPNANKIAQDLDHVSQAAARAGAAFREMPSRLNAFGPAAARAQKASADLHNEVAKSPGHAASASRAFGSLGGALGILGDRFKLSYQAGTLFSAFFSSFTIGQFLKGVYDTNIELAKLQKGLLFSTGSFKDAAAGMQTFIGMTQDLGLNIAKTAEVYNRFTISAKSSGMDLDASNRVFHSVAQTLQIIGASSEQTTLAFYGLTQMMQKGKVMSEEFNRQIGEQIPGNAVIGARALSILKGQYVSVAEFYKQMSLGQIQSAKFVPAYAQALDEQFKALKPLLDERPDVALQRLTGAFTLFQQAVGKAGFMGALGNEFARLKNLIVDVDTNGVAHLKPGVQQLAEQMGHNLSQMVHAAGDAMAYLFQHLPEIITAIKALAALKVGATFLDWGRSAGSFAGSLFTVKKGAEDVAKAKAGAAVVEEVSASGALTAATGAGAAANVRAAFQNGSMRPSVRRQSLFSRFTGAFGAVVGGLGADAYGPQRTPQVSTAAELSDRHPLLTETGAAQLAAESRQNWAASMRRKTRTGANYFEAGTAAEGVAKKVGDLSKLKPILDGAKTAAATFATGGLNLVWGAFSKTAKGGFDFMAILKGIGPMLMTGVVGALLVAGVALAAFGNHMTTVGGKQVQFNDIVGGGFKVLGDHFKEWWEKSGKSIGLFGHTLGDLGKHSGEIVASIVAGFVTLGDVIGRVFGGIAKVAGDLIQNSPLVKIVEIMMHIASGDMKGAGDIIKNYAKSGAGLFTIAGDIADTAGGVASSIGNYGKVRQDVINAAQGSAAERANQGSADAASQERNAQIESDVSTRQKALADMQALGQLQELQNRAKLGNYTTPSLADAIKEFGSSATMAASAAQTTASAATTMAGAAQTSANALIKNIPAAPAGVANAIQGASRVTGVDASLLTAIAYRESKFDVNAANPNSTARGLFQFTKDTGTAYGVDDHNWQDPTAQAIAAANYAVQNASSIKNKTGREATGGELYMAHFLGGSGASKLIQEMAKNPNASFADMFPKEAKANSFTQKMTLQQAYGNLTSTVPTGVNASNLITGQGLAGLTSLEGNGPMEKEDLLQKRLEALTGEVNPAQAAASKLGEVAAQIHKLMIDNQAMVQAGLPSLATPERIAQLDTLRKRLEQQAADAANPFAKDTRVAGEEQAVMALRLKGLDDEANFQAKLNGLKEQGYDITKLDTQVNRDAMKAIADMVDLQSAQLDVVKALNSAEEARIARRGTALDTSIAQGVSARTKPGQTYQQTLSDLKQSGVYDQIVRAAQTTEQSRQTGVSQNFSDQLSEMRSSSRLNPTEKSFRDDYKTYLKEITGVQSDSLDTIASHATAAQKAMAESYAKTKQVLENPPGFQKWADSLEPFAKRLEDIKSNFAEGVSSAITDSIVDPQNSKASWDNLFKTTQRSLVKNSVDTLLGGTIEKLTGKKAPQSPQDIAQVQSQSATVQAQATQTFAQSVETFAQAVQTAASAPGVTGSGTGGSVGGWDGGTSIASQAPMFAPGSLTTSLPAMPNFSASNDNSLLDALTVTGQNTSPFASIAAQAPVIAPGSLTTDIPGLSELNNMVPTGSGGGIMGGLSSLMGSAGSGLSNMFGSGLGAAAGIGSLLYSLLSPHKSNTNTTYPVNGIIGESRPVNISSTQIAAHSNPIAGLLSMGASALTGGSGGGLSSLLGQGSAIGNSLSSLGGMMGIGGGQTLGMAGTGGANLASLAGLFKEGGYSTEPVGSTVMSKHAWRDAPHYAEGTPNTSGGIQAVLHPNEAVIPLSRGRKIPVDMGDSGPSSPTFHNSFTIVTPDPNSFRQSQGSITRTTDRQLRRSSQRNLTGR